MKIWCCVKHVLVIAILALLTAGGLASPAAARSVHVTPLSRGVLHQAGGARQDKIRIAARVSAAATTVPSSVDLSPWTVPVGDQGSDGSCTSWAISYAMGGWYSRYQGWSQAGIQFAPMYTYSQDNGGGDNGSFPSDAYAIAANQGVDTQADYTQGNYDWWDQPTAAERANAANYKAGPFSYLYSGTPGAGAQSAIKSALASHQPVALSIPVYPAFDNLNATNNHLDASQIPGTTSRGGHEVLIVGYDSSGVRIQNSWSTGWGAQGFAWLNWNFVDSYSYEATVMSGLVRPVGGTPDLVVTSLSWAPTAPATGSAVRFTATIKNQGTGATPAGVKHGIAFFVDGRQVNWSDTDTASLAPGASITLTANGGPAALATWKATAGNHTVQAYVDDSKLITETNETNNTLSKPLAA
jgi:hypothetical protein